MPAAAAIVRVLHRWPPFGGRVISVMTLRTFSGASHGMVVGHVAPEAIVGGVIAFVKDGDQITIDVDKKLLQLHVSDEELERRKANWIPHAKPARGVLAKYAKTVSSSSRGAITE